MTDNHQPLRDTVGAAILTGISEADWLKEAPPAAISALLAERDAAVGALKEVVAVFDSNPSSICDAVWVTGNRPETLYDHCLAALSQIKAGREQA